jgi:hypothetical protein
MNLVIFTNGEMNRVYFATTGEKSYDYKVKKSARKFLNPEEVVRAASGQVQDTPYNKDLSCRYFKHTRYH